MKYSIDYTDKAAVPEFEVYYVLKQYGFSIDFDPADVISLTISHADSLDDLRFFPNVRDLCISHSSLDDLGILRTLNELQSLRLEACQINDLSAMANISDLVA